MTTRNRITDAGEYQSLALRFAPSVADGEQLVNAVLGLNGEAGEVADMLKKSLFMGHELDLHKFANELGDILWYLSLAAREAGYTLSDIMTLNNAKLERRYPNGHFTTADSVARVDGL